MIKLDLTLPNGDPLQLNLRDNFAVSVQTRNNNKVTVVADAVHNNGGWVVKEKYTEVIRMIDAQKAKCYYEK